MKAPTDLQILNDIYDRYYPTFKTFVKGAPDRSAKIYVPIDCNKTAEALGVDGDIVFGRLYYHLEKKYGYAQKDGVRVHFFALKVGQDMHCVNFPLLASVVAGLRQDNRKFWITTIISVVALILAVISLTISFYGRGGRDSRMQTTADMTADFRRDASGDFRRG
jgi:hypothetical protein